MSCRMEESSFCTATAVFFSFVSSFFCMWIVFPAWSSCCFFFLDSVCCPLFWALFSLVLRNLFLFSPSSVVITCYTDLELCGKDSGQSRFAVKRDYIFCSIQWKVLLALLFYPLLCSRKTNIAYCSFLSFIRNGP